ncbi:hypothetical protein F5X96DRAFT_616213 [Biscogniauxia mediterranea]|nr:hypothetical protein F5X96DRAFT_616213 [Biscogniauxia mediterranea]
MQTIKSIIVPLFWVITTIISFPGVLSMGNDLPNPYQLSKITWIGSLVENGPNVSFTGHSLEDINAQVKAAFPGHILPSAPKSSMPTNVTKSSARIVCDQVRYSEANYETILSGIEYLRGLSGYCQLGPTEPGAPLKCSRVSCSYNSGIFFCNQNNYDTIQPCHWFGDYAQNVLDECLDPDTYPNIKGQDYDSDGWSVIVGGQSC